MEDIKDRIDRMQRGMACINTPASKEAAKTLQDASAELTRLRAEVEGLKETTNTIKEIQNAKSLEEVHDAVVRLIGKAHQ